MGLVYFRDKPKVRVQPDTWLTDWCQSWGCATCTGHNSTCPDAGAHFSALHTFTWVYRREGTWHLMGWFSECGGSLMLPHRVCAKQKAVTKLRCLRVGACFLTVNQGPLKHCRAKHTPFHCTLQGSRVFCSNKERLIASAIKQWECY